MIYIILALLGLCLGSFVNAFVWRIKEEKDWVKARSQCTHCGHVLGAMDLVPVLSWIALKGSCRYCKKPISIQYPLVELLTMMLFIASYAFWPDKIGNGAAGIVSFVIWLCMIVGLVAISVYDIRWSIIPDKVSYPLIGLAIVHVVLKATVFDAGPLAIRDAVIGLLVGAGLFYAVLELSKGRMIGGGDVKLGIVIGLLLGARDSFIALYVASLSGASFVGILLLLKKATRKSRIPFGPFLVLGAIVGRLFGGALWNWYTTRFLQ